MFDVHAESDEQLVSLYLSGKESSLDILVQRYLTAIYNFVAQFVGYGTEAEDVSQETFIKVWKSLKKFDKTKKFKPWLYRIAKNAAIDYLRQRKIFLSVENLHDEEGENTDNFFIDPKPLPLDVVASLENKEAILRIVDSLPKIYAVVLKLYYLEGFSLPEIAEILSESIDTVKSKHRRALIRIRKLLEKEDCSPE